MKKFIISLFAIVAIAWASVSCGDLVPAGLEDGDLIVYICVVDGDTIKVNSTEAYDIFCKVPEFGDEESDTTSTP